MSAGFEFAKKHEITICGRAYPCDICLLYTSDAADD